jgi:hypothetical protein
MQTHENKHKINASITDPSIPLVTTKALTRLAISSLDRKRGKGLLRKQSHQLQKT